MYVRWKIVQPRKSTAHFLGWTQGDPVLQYVSETTRKDVESFLARRNKENAKMGALVTATLVENRRIDGKPRQKHLAYLASAREAQLQHPLPRLRFHERAKSRMEDMGLSEAQIGQALAQIAKRVPLPTQEELNEAIAKWQQNRQEWQQMLEQGRQAIGLG